MKFATTMNGFQVTETEHTVKYVAYPGAVSEVEILGTQIVMIPQQSKVLAQGNAMSAFPMTMATLQVKELGGRVITVPLSGDCDLFWEEPNKLQGKERV